MTDSGYYDSFRVGANVFVIRDGKLLLGLRKKVFGDGTWGLPGGHLELQERLVEAAARELKEETGLAAERFVFANVVNDYNREGHHIQFGFVAEGVTGEPQVVEPERCGEWRWFALDKLPDNLFIAHRRQIELFVTGEAQFSDG